MLTYTLGELYDNYINVIWKNGKGPAIVSPEGHYLYVYSHEDTIFYVGRSINPIDRLMQHMGYSKDHPGCHDAIGELIKDNLPNSRTWTIAFYSLEDFSKKSDGQEAEWVPFYRLATGNVPGWPHQRETVSDLEDRLITMLRPCMNRTNNKDGAILPAKYIKETSVNKGIQQSEW